MIRGSFAGVVEVMDTFDCALGHGGRSSLGFLDESWN